MRPALRADCSEVASYHAVWRATTAEDFGPAPSGERTRARIANLVTPKHARRASRRQHVRYCLPGHLAALSAAEGEAALDRGKADVAALTFARRQTAAVPCTGVERRLIARTGLCGLEMCRPRPAPASVEGANQQSLAAVANDSVALARGRLQPPTVAHRDRVPVIADQPDLLQCAGDRVHRRLGHTQHFR
jgi:hypothetical protein